jgi:hypothetical protein
LEVFFLLPLLFLFMSLFGEPIAQSHSSSKSLQAEMKPVTEDAAPPSTGIEDRVAREREEYRSLLLMTK